MFVQWKVDASSVNHPSHDKIANNVKFYGETVPLQKRYNEDNDGQPVLKRRVLQLDSSNVRDCAVSLKSYYEYGYSSNNSDHSQSYLLVKLVCTLLGFCIDEKPPAAETIPIFEQMKAADVIIHDITTVGEGGELWKEDSSPQQQVSTHT